MSKPKKQRISPRVYLEGFTNEKGLVNFFDRNNKKYKEQNPKTVTTISDFYTLYDKDGNKNYMIEEFFGKEIESKLPNILGKIDNFEILNSQEKDILAIFITFQFLRTEVFKNSMDKSAMYTMELHHKLICDDEEALNYHIEKYEKDTGEKFPIGKEEYKDMYKNYKITPPKSHFIKMMLGMFNDLYPIFRKMNWVFIIAPKDTSFLTSDNPFSTYNVGGQLFGGGLINPDVIKLFPISRKICINFVAPEVRSNDNFMIYTKVNSKKYICLLNSIIAYNSYRVLIGKDKKLLESIIKKTSLENVEKFSSVTISGPLGTR